MAYVKNYYICPAISKMYVHVIGIRDISKLSPQYQRQAEIFWLQKSKTVGDESRLIAVARGALMSCGIVITREQKKRQAELTFGGI